MKLTLVFVVVVVIFFLAGGHSFFTNLSANAQIVNRQNLPDDNDLQLAGTIRRLTNRSTEGLTERQIPKGGYLLDLPEGFQNVMLSKLDYDGEPISACVTSLAEANEFFGRNLETGEAIASTRYRRDDTEKAAALHGMNVAELEYYKKLIADAAARRALSPEAATINIINADGADEGFNDPTATTPEGGNTGTTRGQQRLILFNTAASVWGAFLDSSVPVNVNSQFNPLTPCSTSGGVLGSAGTTGLVRDFNGAQFPATWYPAALANKRGGTDFSANSEINATFNSSVDTGCLGTGTRFYYGLDNATPSGRINLLIVLLHEMGHGFGFQSFVNGSTGALNGGFTDVFTNFMYDRTTAKYWSQMTNAERQASAINAGNVLWDGPSVKIASGNLTAGREPSTGRVQLYTPGTFAGGSSISHFDTAVTPSVLMEPNITVGLPLTLDLTRQQMRDIGWYRDTTNDLVPDTIENVQPSGSTLVIGSTVTISWTNTGGFNRNVTVELSTDGGANYTAIATDISNTGSLTFTVPNQPTTQGRIRVREHNFVEPAGVSAVNFSISTTAPPTNNRRPVDFDGDGKTDISIFRPSNGQWWINRSSTLQTVATQFGASTDKPMPADFTGDGKSDIAFFRPSTGEWFIVRSEDNSFLSFTFGTNNDTPIIGDFDADGKADPGVYRPSTREWFVLKSTGGVIITTFGTAGDVPVVADYDGDGKTDIAIYRPSAGQWWIQRSSNGSVYAFQFGTSSDKPVQGDYSGDGKADSAFFRPSTGEWFILRSENSSFYSVPFGASGDLPVPGDYDGDGKFDTAVFRPSANDWYINRSTAGLLITGFGITGDRPLPNVFVP